MRYDYVIVGAGLVGSVITDLLSDGPGQSVLVLETRSDYGDVENLPDDVRLGNNTWLSAYGLHADAW